MTSFYLAVVLTPIDGTRERNSSGNLIGRANASVAHTDPASCGENRPPEQANDASRASDRKDSTPQLRQEPAAVRDFGPAYDGIGSKVARGLVIQRTTVGHTPLLRLLSAIPSLAPFVVRY